MAEVCLRPWRASDAADVAEMAADEHVRRWSTLGADVDAWLAGEVAQARGPSRAICVAGEDRALGRVAFRPPGLVLDIEPSNEASIRLPAGSAPSAANRHASRPTGPGSGACLSCAS